MMAIRVDQSLHTGHAAADLINLYMDKLEEMPALDRSEETFRLVHMLQLLLQSAGTLWPAMQQAVFAFLQAMFEKLAILRWGPAPRAQGRAARPLVHGHSGAPFTQIGRAPRAPLCRTKAFKVITIKTAQFLNPN